MTKRALSRVISFGLYDHLPHAFDAPKSLDKRWQEGVLVFLLPGEAEEATLVVDIGAGFVETPIGVVVVDVVAVEAEAEQKEHLNEKTMGHSWQRGLRRSS